MRHANRGKFKLFSAVDCRVGIVVGQFNREITEQLLESCLAMLDTYGVTQKNVLVYRVAGSIEIPVILKKFAETGKYDCLIAIGAVIRGETAHFEYVAKIVSEGVLRIMLDFGLPVGFAILTTENLAQAKARVSAGAEAAEAALQNLKIIRDME